MKALLVILLFCSFQCHAYSDRACYSASGTPTVTTYNAEKTISTKKNVAGSVVYQGSAQNVGKSFTYSCECADKTGYAFLYWSGVSDFPSASANYLQITPEFKAGVNSFIYTNTSGGNYYSIPFSGITSQFTSPCDESNKSTKSAIQTRIDLIITKPFIGNLSFHGVVGRVYLSRSASAVNQADPPVVVINLDLELSVPDACTVRPGGVITVDLGQNIRQGQFRGQNYPLPPKSYTPRSLDLTFDCNFSNADVDVTLTGNKDAQQQGFASTRPDVSVIVTDDEGKIISPDSFAGDVNVKADKSSTTLHLKAYPTNSGEHAIPEAGSYSAAATILLSYK
ncbi:fimbrial protein [Rahnella woolbedingensis]|uniref:Fimbrial-type adhesion domain-containing protein n=1 Tax=Rahnella woolbedingensis TaxID=1510574 RepID=A0A419N2A5_9GAMM|nr:fimbrial protein [Rahnella woolbedingensis]RJT32586.1 hypothetical protein D6C13_24530 [Rahnella woolbedingensis]